MTRYLKQFVLAGLMFGLVAGSLVHCDSGLTRHECDTPANCNGLSWPMDADCSSDDGEWDCINTTCVPVCDDSCGSDAECDGNTWPGDADCEEADGEWKCKDNVCEAFCLECVLDEDCPELPGCEGGATDWECLAGTCSPICCLEDGDCTDWLWEEDCVGHFQCDRDTCSRICDDVGCGDDTCEAGETVETCPDDCLLICADSDACTIYDFPLPCSGYWSCDAGECAGVCDYNTCGDGNCETYEGPACPEDCLNRYCVGDESCAQTKGWPQACEGHWDCLAGVYTCIAQCDGPCGNGICEPAEGEDGETCTSDCVVGPCQLGVADCFLNAWDAQRGTLCAGLGHWVCDAATATCDRVCEQDDCGDGACDPTMGESPDSCPTDCTDYDCLDATDCDALTLPAGCDAGQWQCFRKVCWPDC